MALEESRPMGEDVAVMCPWCGDEGSLWVERDTEGTFVQDCDVCCRPWSVTVGWTDDGPTVVVDRA